MWRYHLISSPGRAGVTGGTLAGAITGFLFGAEGPSLVVGRGRCDRRHALCDPPRAGGAAPTGSARRAVRRRTGDGHGRGHRGLPTTDRRLAPAVIGYAETVLGRHRTWVGTKGSFLIMPLVAGVQVLLAVDDVRDDDAPVAVVRLISAVIALLVPEWLARGAVRADRAEQSARSLLG